MPNSPEFGKTVAVVFLYGLRPVSWDGDLIVIIDPNSGRRLVFSGDPTDEVPRPALDALLDAIGMDEATFWQLYETV